MKRIIAALLIAQPAAAQDTLLCSPALPVFCANIHVGCSGKTDFPTSEFMVAGGQITFDNGEAVWSGGESTASGTVYRKPGTRDWIRISPDQRFSQRIYTAKGPVMAYGTCR